MGKRRYGSGAVKLRSDGRWEGQLRLADGSRRSLYAHTREQVNARLQEERWRLTWGIPVPARGLILSEYLPQWLDVARARLRPSTHEAYEICSRRIAVELGDVPLAKLTPQLVQRAYSRLLDNGLSVRTVFQTHAVLHRALKQARMWGLMSGNPTELVAAPRPGSREMTALSGAQLSQLLASARDSRWYPLWVVLGTAGLRIGEALGLRWSDIDLDRGCLQVRRALQRQRGRGLVFIEPKTQRSRRLVCLCDLAVEALREHRKRSTAEHVFVNRKGEPQESSSVTSALDAALVRARLPRIRVHDLRHTTATVLLEAGTHPKLVQDLLGHSTVALTLNTYSHVTAGLSGEAARTMDCVLHAREPAAAHR